MQDIDKNSLDIKKVNIEKLKQLFPSIVTDGKIDFEMLKALLGEEIDTSNEKYSFTWNGKVDCIKFAQTPSTGTLIPCKEKSINWKDTNNIYIEGDNAEVLKLLQKTYVSKVDVIYIDPPYNTGKDFVYKDNFEDSISNYKSITSQQNKANVEYDGRFHSLWLNMIYPRLVLSHNILSDRGVIFISIDDNEYANLKKVCDEIFGEINYVSTIIYERAFSPVNLKKHFSSSHDYILCYAKNIDKAINSGIKRSNESDSRYQNPDNDSRGPWTSGDMSVGPAVENNIYEIVTPSGRKCMPPSGYSWRLSKERYDEYVKDGRIWFGTDGSNVPRIKRFLSEVKQGITPMTVWHHEDVGHSQEAQQQLKALFDGKAYFDYPKSVKLIKQLVSLYSTENSIVLDFFSGSATTAQAVMELNAEDNGNRKYILVQLPELLEEKSEAFKDGFRSICDIGEERIRRAIRKICKTTSNVDLFNNHGLNATVDAGFKVFKLESTNIRPWDSSIKLDETTIFNNLKTIKDDRTKLDVAYEIMLKYGVFDMPISEVSINNKNMFSVGDGYMIICLEDEIAMDDVTEIAKLNPHCVVFKEDGFANDNEKINATYTLERFKVEKILCI